MDVYKKGTPEDILFCNKAGVKGNKLVFASASGTQLGKDAYATLRKKELSGILRQYRRLPPENRQPELAAIDPSAKPARPQPPQGGLVLKCHCSYLEADQSGNAQRAKQYYFKENANRWEAETQTDTLWITADEWQAMVPKPNAVEGETFEVPSNIQSRFFSTVGIDFMDGSSPSLKTRQSKMSLTIDKVTPKQIELSLNGYGRMGKDFDPEKNKLRFSRGCEVRLIGKWIYNLETKSFATIEIAGIGEAWGFNDSLRHHDVRIGQDRWLYGVACELVSPDSPENSIPPYNMLHYKHAGPYFKK